MTTQTYPCTACGAKLQFAPGQHALQCPYCGAQNAIPEADQAVQDTAVAELDYQHFLDQAAGNEATIERQTVKCPACGAQSQLPEHTTADKCPFCTAPLIASKATSLRLIQPRAVAPFEIPEADARNRFRGWIDGLWFAPNALKQAYRAATGLKGLYLPYWTYDANTDTPYTGERGDYYYVTETYTENGVTKTRQVQRVRWSPAAGQVAVSFDDITVPASRSLPQDYLNGLEPWRLSGLKPYREDYLAGFTVEAYQIGLQPGFEIARGEMEGGIRNAIERDIGGDLQRIHSMSPRYFDITFKHILLPVWLSSYQYGGKTWRFLVNGQTGEVQGERPWSYWKIGFAVLGGLLVLLFVLMLLSES
ncbi:zinc ribbon domain-containing protein [Chitinimonas sp. BJYL2]|uniref:zinc ribbon domain-containing protein n=1 Tax=Chitinimonas sp. BJYL2 TaxID=2976696 RepID=UPI0022B350CD|nr:zinc ribbon domain-containing protein [Chitinimonas sp. BJYL2]